MYTPKRFECYYKALFFNYRIKYSHWWAEQYKKWYHGYEFHFVRIGLENVFMDIENWYYDGNVYKGIIFCYIGIGYGYGCDVEELKDEPKDI